VNGAKVPATSEVTESPTDTPTPSAVSRFTSIALYGLGTILIMGGFLMFFGTLYLGDPDYEELPHHMEPGTKRLLLILSLVLVIVGFICAFIASELDRRHQAGPSQAEAKQEERGIDMA
jgi:membrane-bound ClpP family serine protease